MSRTLHDQKASGAAPSIRRSPSPCPCASSSASSGASFTSEAAATLGAVRSRSITAVLLSGCLALAACGGGGGSDNTAVSGPDATPPPSAPSAPSAPYAVSGSVSVSEFQTVDTDTNDPTQIGHRSNNAFTTLQPLPNPGLATGYLTVAGGGAVGAVSAAGDLVDGYTVTLQAGQVVELDFAADPVEADVDLFLYDQNRNLVGRSIGVNSYECIGITAAGTYTIAAQMYADGSSTGTLYRLRVGAPGSAQCPTSQGQPAAFAADSVVALAAPAPGSPVLPAAAAARKGLVVRSGGGDDTGSFMLLSVPSDEASMARVLAANRSAGGAAVSAATTSKSLEAARHDPAWRAGMSAQARSAHAAIDLSKSLVKHGQYQAASPNVKQFLLADPMPVFPPNDRDYAQQAWHYGLISLPAAAARMQSMTSPQAEPPIVAVVDTGIVADHPDLRSQLVAGYDFVSDPSMSGDGNGMDANPDDSITLDGWGFHGTHVAGTVAASTGNSIGVAGVAPVARVMPLRALGANEVESGGDLNDIIQAILYAARLPNASGTLPARKADVINLSLGAPGTCPSTYTAAFAQVRESGVMVVAAAGNSSDTGEGVDNAVGMPANCANVFAVSAVNPQRRRSYYSDAGQAIALAAPGGDTTKYTLGFPEGDGILSTIAVNSRGGRSPDYQAYQGTSMASPHVAGVLALMRWVNPAITPAQVEALVRAGTISDDLGPTGWDREYGYGLINAEKAVIAALASRGGGGTTPTPGGQVSAQPATLFLGSIGETAEFMLSAVGTAAEQVTSVTADSTAISVAPKAGAVDATTRLGTYVVTANRAAVPDNTTVYPNVLVQLTGGRQIAIPVGIERRSGGTAIGAAAGPIYVLVVDANSDEGQVVAQAAVPNASAQGAYPYTVAVPGTPRIWVIAGSDLDNDGFICNKGENCGLYPFLGTTPTVLQPTDTLSGINFAVSPIGGTNTGAGAGAAVPSAAATAANPSAAPASAVPAGNSPFKQVHPRQR